MPRVLLIDDDAALVRGLHIGLEALGHAVSVAATGRDGLSRAAVDSPDVVVVDLGLPDIDGIELCRQLREWSSVPIVVLSADGREDRKVEAFEYGADDYVTKPFGIREFDARLRVAQRHAGTSAETGEAAVFTAGDLVVDLVHHEVRLRGEAIDLTSTELAFLAYLVKNAGKLCSHQLILSHVWGLRSTDAAGYLHVYAYRLRKKLHDDQGTLIVTVPRVGYKLSIAGAGGREAE